jgi:folate-binding protein YgfZ
MTDIPITGGLLPHLGVIRFAGADAAAFLQGQVSNDTRRLAAGSAILAAYSTPQGRVLALLHLLPHSSGILGLLPREILLPTVERLRKFVMRAKVQIEDVSTQFPVAGYHGDGALREIGLKPPAPPADGATAVNYTEHDGVGVARVRADEARCWVVGTTGARAAADAAAGAIARVDDAWRLADIRSGLPQIYAATREMFVAQMLNLDRIDGISFTKGCFTGQEIIARTQHLGRIKRRLFRLRLPAGVWTIGQAVHLRDGRTGRLTEIASIPDGIEALAVLTDIGTPVEGDTSSSTLIDAAELPLPYAF